MFLSHTDVFFSSFSLSPHPPAPPFSQKSINISLGKDEGKREGGTEEALLQWILHEIFILEIFYSIIITTDNHPLEAKSKQ